MSTPPEFDIKLVEEMNRKAIENQLFTPDHVYLDLGLLKDIPLGIIYADKLNNKASETEFKQAQDYIGQQLEEYQKRLYDTVDPFFTSMGYNDDRLDILLSYTLSHDLVFLMSPATYFLQTLVRHTLRNQNNSAPAYKYIKKKIDADQFILESMPVTYYINTFPLSLSLKLQEKLAPELGESLGVNIQFLNKNPQLFDGGDWDRWMNKIECFYFDCLGKMTRSPFVLDKQSNLQFAGVYFFARKRFEKCVMPDMRHLDMDHQIQMATSQLDMLCDFAWLQNNDVRLTEHAENSEEESPPDTQGTQPS